MIANDPEDFDDLLKQVVDEGGIATIKMETLRKLNGSDRLGSNVISAISEDITDVGLSHYPETLPTNKDKIVLLFANKTNLGRVFAKLSNIREDTDEQIRELTEASSNDAKKMVSQIRKILAQS